MWMGRLPVDIELGAGGDLPGQPGNIGTGDQIARQPAGGLAEENHRQYQIRHAITARLRMIVRFSPVDDEVAVVRQRLPVQVTWIPLP